MRSVYYVGICGLPYTLFQSLRPKAPTAVFFLQRCGSSFFCKGVARPFLVFERLNCCKLLRSLVLARVTCCKLHCLPALECFKRCKLQHLLALERFKCCILQHWLVLEHLKRCKLQRLLVLEHNAVNCSIAGLGTL